MTSRQHWITKIHTPLNHTKPPQKLSHNSRPKFIGGSSRMLNWSLYQTQLNLYFLTIGYQKVFNHLNVRFQTQLMYWFSFAKSVGEEIVLNKLHTLNSKLPWQNESNISGKACKIFRTMGLFDSYANHQILMTGKSNRYRCNTD